LEEHRQIIKQTVPTASEVISYDIPAHKLNGVLAYFAVNKQQIGFYPAASPIVVFKDELTAYNTSKGAIQFPVKNGIPGTLGTKIVKHRENEYEARSMATKEKKK